MVKRKEITQEESDTLNPLDLAEEIEEKYGYRGNISMTSI